MRSQPSDARSDGSEVRSTVLCTLLHSTNPKFVAKVVAPNLMLGHRKHSKLGSPRSNLPRSNGTNKRFVLRRGFGVWTMNLWSCFWVEFYLSLPLLD
ncbi:hypothetical protein RHMOL_Rhmol13G0127400 [Rhododendron molle]|uniref:Uncharacterized protein n=1 Tax=Rhododendron molle TaxID=49168 RepID=A0ACC0L6X7_RHOML|nr:hypothetical protein RHMOL_Rhmol13G0127400 [Rhododendron molle]